MAAALRGGGGDLEEMLRNDVARMDDEGARAWLREYLPEYRS
jgi:hypothetical protein